MASTATAMAADGSAWFRTVQAAVDVAPANSSARTTIAWPSQ